MSNDVPKMRWTNQAEDQLRSFMDAATEGTTEIWNEHAELISILSRIVNSWNFLGPELRHGNFMSYPLFFAAHSTYLAAVRTATAGHTAAVWPLVRAALEAALYAVIVSGDDALAQKWADPEFDRRERSRLFTAKKGIELVRADSADIASYISQVYETSIDFGAHPNRLGVVRHLEFGETDENYEMSFAVLWQSSHHRVIEGLVSCVDGGIATLLALCIATRKKDQQVADKVYEIWFAFRDLAREKGWIQKDVSSH